jgi:hypothetical protein
VRAWREVEKLAAARGKVSLTGLPQTRAMIALMVERNVRKLEKWLQQTAKKDPAKAADLFLRAFEYHVPKLARTEYTGLRDSRLNARRAR